MRCLLVVMTCLALPLGGLPAAAPAARSSARQAAETIERVFPNGRGTTWSYDEGALLDGMDALYLESKHPADLAYIRRCVDRFLTPQGTVTTYAPEELQLDHILMARQFLFLYRQTGDQKYLDAAKPFYEQLKRQPRTPEGGFWHKKRYPNQMWLDGLYMAEPFYAEYALLTHHPEDFKDIALQFALVEEHTRDAKTGLLFHAWDASPAGRKQPWADPLTGRSPILWARALGWYGMALVDTLDDLPAGSAEHAQLVAQLRRCGEALARAQDTNSGLWWQVLDRPGAKGNYLESSAAAMFVYTLAKGARLGYLPKADRAAADRGFHAIEKQFVQRNAAGQLDLTGTADAVGLGGTPYRDGTYAYYTGVKQITNDARGLGAWLLACVEMEQR